MQDIEATEPPQGRHKASLKAIAQDLNLKDKTGPAIEGELAELMNALPVLFCFALFLRRGKLRVFHCTKGAFLQSLAFLICWLCTSYEFYVRFLFYV